uniref:Sel1 repeat family protein n=1 Tax=Alexandrium catenella TaxID=2925 RepID=A0A7S1WEF4_ALECA
MWPLVLALLAVPLLGARAHFIQLRPQAQLAPDWPGSQRLQEIAAFEFQEAIEAWQLQNLLGSIRLFLRSAQKGYEVGEYCFRWGQYHELPPSDIARALRWYRRGARMNHKASLTMLGKLHYAMGHPAEARRWLLRTAAPNGDGGATGDSLSQWFLAEMGLQGGALREAVRWWKRSAENGDVDAMMRLAQVFSEGGAGIPQDTMRSRHWLLAAAAHGHQDALNRVDWSRTGRPKAERRWIEDMQQRGWV